MTRKSSSLDRKEDSEEIGTTEKMKDIRLKWNSQLVFFPCPLIRKKFQDENLIGANKYVR